jgi:hypothetical protein
MLKADVRLFLCCLQIVLSKKRSNFNAFVIGLFDIHLQQLMERRIRPWINKKIIEYIGEPEPTLVDFICSKVLAGSAPQGILDDVQMVSCGLWNKAIQLKRLTFLQE